MPPLRWGGRGGRWEAPRRARHTAGGKQTCEHETSEPPELQREVRAGGGLGVIGVLSTGFTIMMLDEVTEVGGRAGR